MRLKIIIASGLLALISVLCVAVDSPRNNGPSAPVAQSSAQADAMRMEGEKRFRANCGRCHAAPQKFPPRMMATIVRHMRVRATITDEDMRLVLYYMTR
jgi:mono/diheme cytochrome c family protein